MALYLDEIEREYLKTLLAKNPNTWWPHKKLVEKIQAEEKRLAEMKACPHAFGEYTGKKQCCMRCGAYDENMGFAWTLAEAIEKPGAAVSKRMASNNSALTLFHED